MTGTRVVLFPGERLDGILMAEQAIGKYILDIQGLRDCRNLRQEAFILYEDAALDSHAIRTTDIDNFDERSFKIVESGHHCHRISKNVICSLDLKSRKLSQLEEKADETIYVPFDTNTFSFFTDEMTDNSYNIYMSRYYPAYLSLKKGAIRIPQINGMSFKYPSSPILSQPENILEKLVCSLDKHSSECADTPLFCECLQLLQVPSRKTIEIILINKGFGGNASYTFHLHGYSASIIGRESFEQPLTKDEIIFLDLNGKIHRNLVNPVRKDTFVVPNKGYIILRFYTDNLGYWLWEARSTAVYPPLFGPGMQFLMRKSETEDVWDDTALIQAYDRAVNLAKEEVAKRIAMDTQDQPTKQKSQNSKCSNHTKKPFKKWTVGAPCRAVYSVDGEVYEAIISKIHQNSGMCTVKFVGYQNTEKVEINSLLESEGLQSQISQHKDALAQKANEEVIDSDTSTYSNLRDSKQISSERMDCDTEVPKSVKNNFMPGTEYFNPAIDAIPLAPPFPPLMAKLPETDEDALSSMLMSWYLSGYHTGYYQGFKQAKINQQKKRNYQ